MANLNYNSGFYNSNPQFMNSLYRQKENIENLINQYSQPPQQQAPVQNIINTTPSSNVDFEARIINKDDDPSNIVVTRRTLFVNEGKKKIYIKETDGTISKEYDIIIPLDEKEKKILELEKRVKELEEKENVQHTKSNEPINGIKRQDEISNESIKPTTKTDVKPISKSK